MAYDPNDPRSDLGVPPGTAPRDRPDVVNHVETRRSGPSWVPWVAILAVLLIGAFVWSNMGSGTDPDTTDTANPPAVTDEAPEPAPAAPAPAEPAPAPAEPATPGNDAAPADNGG